jgi:hypothetical protein
MSDKNISYLNKTFTDFKSNLVNYAKTYFPNTYNDFSEASPGNMFIEMASYVGDVMSFYVDTQVQENFLLYAKEKENLYALSYAFGYRPKASYASSTDLDVYQLVPSIVIDGQNSPNYNIYGLIIPENTSITSTSTSTKFLTLDKIDFTDTGSTEITFVNENFYLFKKTVKVISAEIKITNFTYSTPQKFQTSIITDDNILQILNVTGSGGNNDIWYEVPYLAQSSIFEPVANPSYNTDQVPYLLNLKRVPKRFVSRILSDNTLQLEFGAGIANSTDNQIIPTPDNIQLGLVPGISNLSNNYNKASVFFTREYGLAPSNTTLQVKYLVGGGITSNVPSNDLTIIDTTGVYFKNGNPGGFLSNEVLNSVVSNNPTPSIGGRDGDQVEEIRNNALFSYSAQNRAVTKDDYIIRTLSLPADYGNIAKVYITQDFERSQTLETSTTTKNPLALDLYVLAYNSNKQLITSSNTLKNNLVTYLNQYRMITDAINIKDAFYINIGVNFDITVQSGYNNNDVVTNCITMLQNHFNIEKWQINQPITISEINSKLLQIQGVKSVVKVEIINKQDSTGNTYSQYGYDISGATKNDNIYPSLDPSIFELRYPNTDIQGRVVAN